MGKGILDQHLCLGERAMVFNSVPSTDVFACVCAHIHACVFALPPWFSVDAFKYENSVVFVVLLADGMPSNMLPHFYLGSPHYYICS